MIIGSSPLLRTPCHTLLDSVSGWRMVRKGDGYEEEEEGEKDGRQNDG
jgi:hypothetical protein